MQIVIDIDNDVYKRALVYKDVQLTSNSANDLSELTTAVANGTPLPKRHGRLIDADALPLNAIDDANHGSNYIKIAPTIIEADRAESEEV